MKEQNMTWLWQKKFAYFFITIIAIFLFSGCDGGGGLEKDDTITMKSSTSHSTTVSIKQTTPYRISWWFENFESIFGYTGDDSWDWTVADGSVDVEHRFDVSNVSNGQCVGETIDFSYNPKLTYYATGGLWDTPYGDWCDNTEKGCNIDFEKHHNAYQNISGSNYTDTQGHVFTGYHGWIHWTGIKPQVTISSSNPSIVSCSAMTCTILQEGTVTLYATTTETALKIWDVASSYGTGEAFKNDTAGKIFGLDRTQDTTITTPYNMQEFYYFSPTRDANQDVFKGGMKWHYRENLDENLVLPALTMANRPSWTIETGCDEAVQCGTKDGQTAPTYAEIPGTKCSDNSNPVVTEVHGRAQDGSTTTQWLWTCGANTQNPAQCSASKTEGPEVGPDCNKTDLTQPPTQLCTKGTVTTPPGLTGTGTAIDPWTWTCSLNGQTSEVCTAQETIPNTPPACGSTNTTTPSIKPTANLCTSGTPSVVQGSGFPWDWTCSANNQTVQCSAACPDNSVMCSDQCLTVNIPHQVNLLRTGGAEPAKVTIPAGVWCDVNGDNIWEDGAEGSGTQSTVVEVAVTSHPMTIDDLSCKCGPTRGPQGCPAGQVPYGNNKCCSQDDWNPRTHECGTRTIQGTIQCVCTARKCSSAGTCTATPVFASSYASSACASECSSNADCSSGSIVEVR